MKKYLLLVNGGEILPLGLNLLRDGHIVHTLSEFNLKRYFGLLEQYGGVDGECKYDCVIMDKGLEDIKDLIKNKGYNIIGSNNLTEILSNDTTYLSKVLGFNGLKLGICPGEISLHIEIWINHKYPLGVTYSLIEKTLMGNLKSPKVPMGATVWVGSFDDLLYKKVFSKLVNSLIGKGYVGSLGFDISISKDEIYINKFTAFPDINTLFITLELLQLNLSNFLTLLCSNDNTQLKFRSPLGIGVTFAQHPFPNISNAPLENSQSITVPT